MHTILTGGGYFWLSMWGGGHEVLLDCELHRNIKSDVGLDVGLKYKKNSHRIEIK